MVDSTLPTSDPLGEPTTPTSPALAGSTGAGSTSATPAPVREADAEVASVPLSETLGALARAKQIGLARHIGISNFTVALIEEAVAACPEPLVCDQVEYHPYLDQTKVMEACARHGMALVAYSPVAKGRVKNDQALKRIGDRYRKTAAQICLRWLVQQNVAAIPRTSRLERLSENIEIFDFELSDADMRAISEMGSANRRLTDFAFAPKWD